MYITLEDEFGDIVGKARRGREMSVADLADKTDLKTAQLEQLEEYEWTPEGDGIQRLAQVLELDPQRLQASAQSNFFPLYPEGRGHDGLVLEMMVLGSDFLMNGYVVGCAQSRRGLVVDPGFDAEKILRTVESTGLTIEKILLTHGHGDHIGCLSEICQATGAPAFIHAADVPLIGNLRTKIEGELVDGQVIEMGSQQLQVQSTPGHTPGGVSLVHQSLALVGDALFAGSLGGTRSLPAYRSQMQAVADKILTLDEAVVLYPGHGPATSVGEERRHNPFFIEANG
ncbi:MAG: MBL fold metallo-hydrolase [Candidatus Latescibacteria bacterium]|nr:MBL fold metallo-hydrolase [Candidatus Latescibacterota bacterium]